LKMKRACLFLSIGVVSFLLCFTLQALAEEDELAGSGTLAGSATGGFGATNVPSVWGDKDGYGDGGSSPISGSVSKVDKSTWLLKVFNNSEDQFKVNLEVVQFDIRNKKVKSDNYYYPLKGKQSIERKIKSFPTAVNAAVNLKNWKRNERKKTSSELKAEIESTKKKLSELEAQLKGSSS
jgi:hypothetical protein